MDLKTIAQNPFFVKYQVFILPTVSIGISLLLFVLVIIPQTLSFIGSFSTITDTESKITNLNKKAEILTQVDQGLYRNNINTTLIAFPAEKDIPGSISQLLFLLNSSNLKLGSMGFSGGTANQAGATLNSFQVKLEVEGSLSDVKTFVNKFKEVPRIMKVSGIELSGRAEAVQASITLTTYYQDLVNDLGDVEKPLELVNDKETQILSQIENYTKSIPIVTTNNVSGPTGKSDPFQ